LFSKSYPDNLVRTTAAFGSCVLSASSPMRFSLRPRYDAGGPPEKHTKSQKVLGLNTTRFGVSDGI